MLRRLLARRRPAAAPVQLVLYTRRECPLCERMKAIVRGARTSRPFELREIDIDTDGVLRARHGRSIPVLEIAGRIAFKGRVTAEDFERKFERHLRERKGRERGPGVETS